ncbi:hypothetical protein MIND_01417900 [Mycena indigotica]|uniref:Uncharacterized protein n=1 Tax=Mycena indigotica TaxID=2126181 RepID=A0A8H6VUI4_9AGAR|nr:uncharacterized protein MIND_01417900 [Mycena indigotica]KAF7288729.1 hypothetical protein MIND_01417900 [Mycena indigotica]
MGPHCTIRTLCWLTGRGHRGLGKRCRCPECAVLCRRPAGEQGLSIPFPQELDHTLHRTYLRRNEFAGKGGQSALPATQPTALLGRGPQAITSCASVLPPLARHAPLQIQSDCPDNKREAAGGYRYPSLVVDEFSLQHTLFAVPSDDISSIFALSCTASAGSSQVDIGDGGGVDRKRAARCLTDVQVPVYHRQAKNNATHRNSNTVVDTSARQRPGLLPGRRITHHTTATSACPSSSILSRSPTPVWPLRPGEEDGQRKRLSLGGSVFTLSSSDDHRRYLPASDDAIRLCPPYSAERLRKLRGAPPRTSSGHGGDIPTRNDKQVAEAMSIPSGLCAILVNPAAMRTSRTPRETLPCARAGRRKVVAGNTGLKESRKETNKYWRRRLASRLPSRKFATRGFLVPILFRQRHGPHTGPPSRSPVIACDANKVYLKTPPSTPTTAASGLAQIYWFQASIDLAPMSRLTQQTTPGEQDDHSRSYPDLHPEIWDRIFEIDHERAQLSALLRVILFAGTNNHKEYDPFVDVASPVLRTLFENFGRFVSLDLVNIRYIDKLNILDLSHLQRFSQSSESHVPVVHGKSFLAAIKKAPLRNLSLASGDPLGHAARELRDHINWADIRFLACDTLDLLVYYLAHPAAAKVESASLFKFIHRSRLIPPVTHAAITHRGLKHLIIDNQLPSWSTYLAVLAVPSLQHLIITAGSENQFCLYQYHSELAVVGGRLMQNYSGVTTLALQYVVNIDGPSLMCLLDNLRPLRQLDVKQPLYEQKPFCARPDT